MSFKSRLWIFSFVFALFVNVMFLFLINKERVDAFLKDIVNNKDFFDISFMEERLQPEEEKGRLVAGFFDGVKGPDVLPVFTETLNQQVVKQIEGSLDSELVDNRQQLLVKVDNEIKNNSEINDTAETKQIDNRSLISVHEAVQNESDALLSTNLDVHEAKPPVLVSFSRVSKTDVLRKKVARQKTLSELTQAALAQLASRVGNGHFDEMGDSQKGPSDFQLLRERYWSQVERVWQQVCRTTQAPAFVGTSLVSVVVRLTFFENGCLKNIQLHRSSGSASVDDYIVRTFLEAHNQFPPIPERVRQHDGLERICTIYFYPDRTGF